MTREPVLLICGAAVSIVTAVISLVVAFGIHVSDTQGAAIIALVTIVANLAAAIVTRGKVTPTG